MIVPFVGTDFIEAHADNPIANWLFGAGVVFSYYFVFETLFQKTPAKFITGTKVIMTNGSKPDPRIIARRTLSRLVPFEALSIYTGNLPEKAGTWWHDRWTDTRVVRG